MITLFATSIIVLVVAIAVIGILAIQGSKDPYIGFANTTVTNIRNGRMPTNDIKILRESIKRQKEEYDIEQAKNARMKGD